MTIPDNQFEYQSDALTSMLTMYLDDEVHSGNARVLMQMQYICDHAKTEQELERGIASCNKLSQSALPAGWLDLIVQWIPLVFSVVFTIFIAWFFHKSLTLAELIGPIVLTFLVSFIALQIMLGKRINPYRSLLLYMSRHIEFRRLLLRNKIRIHEAPLPSSIVKKFKFFEQKDIDSEPYQLAKSQIPYCSIFKFTFCDGPSDKKGFNYRMGGVWQLGLISHKPFRFLDSWSMQQANTVASTAFVSAMKRNYKVFSIELTEDGWLLVAVDTALTKMNSERRRGQHRNLNSIEIFEQRLISQELNEEGFFTLVNQFIRDISR